LTKLTGKAGEEQAAVYLLAKNWEIVARNWRTRRGEIDIIAMDGDTLVFVEVKTWPHGQEADLETVIGPTKKKRMIETAKHFLAAHRQYNGMYIRFDVVFLSSDPLEGGLPEIRHFESAIAERESW